MSGSREHLLYTDSKQTFEKMPLPTQFNTLTNMNESRLTISSSAKAEKRVRWGEEEESNPYFTFEDYKAYKGKCKNYS